MPPTLRCTLLGPLLFLLIGWLGYALMEHSHDTRVWNESVAVWAGPAPDSLRYHEPYLESQATFWPVKYFTYAPTREQLQLIQQSMQLVPVAEPRAVMQYCIAREKGNATVQRLYTRQNPIISYSYDQSAVGFVPHLALLSDGRCIHLTEHCITEPQQESKPSFPQLSFQPPSFIQRVGEPFLLMVLLILPALLNAVLWGRGTVRSWRAAYARLLLPLFACLFWYFIAPEPNEDGIYMAPFAMIFTLLASLCLFTVDFLKKDQTAA